MYVEGILNYSSSLAVLHVAHMIVDDCLVYSFVFRQNLQNKWVSWYIVSTNLVGLLLSVCTLRSAIVNDHATQKSQTVWFLLI